MEKIKLQILVGKSTITYIKVGQRATSKIGECKVDLGAASVSTGCNPIKKRVGKHLERVAPERKKINGKETNFSSPV